MLRVFAPFCVILLLAGCAQRTITIRSDPPGAKVWLNREPVEVMTTPAVIPFDFYGTYSVRLELEGYEPLEAMAAVPTPWYSYPVLDIFSDLVFSFAVNDRHEFDYVLVPLSTASPEETEEEMERRRQEAVEFHEAVKVRAEKLRTRVNEGDPAEVE